MNFFFNNKLKNIFIYLTFILIFIVGILSFSDYGVAVDEWDLKILGIINANYLLEIFNFDPINFKSILPNLNEYYGSTHGPIFVTLMSLVENIFNIEDSDKIFLLRHYINHLIFFISLIYFFLLVNNRYSDWKMGLIGAIFIFLTPRIFAHSFFNYKDILFLSLTIINLYYGICFLKKTNFKNIILFSLTASFATNIRVIGLMIPVIIILVHYIEVLRDNKKNSQAIFFLIFFTLLFTYLFWPYLWSDPISKLYEIINRLSSYGWTGYNFYLGEYIKATNLPWHYFFIWIGITTPIFFLVLFLLGIFSYIFRLVKRLLNISENLENLNDLWRGKKESEDFIFLICLTIPIMIVVLLGSPLYNGWRHLFFLYPFFILFSLRGLYLIKILFLKKKLFIFYLIVTASILNVAYTNYKYHPYQNNYFNFLAGKEANKRFDTDYWGLSNKQAIEKILDNEKNFPVKVASVSQISLENSMDIFDINKKKKVIVTSVLEADYIIDNYIYWYGTKAKKKAKIPKDFKLFFEKIIDENKIYSIYRKG